MVAAGAGGHAGTLHPIPLINEIRKFFNKTILLSGCLSSGKDVASALQMGADFAYMGTRFINVTESNASEDYKQMIIQSSAEDIIYTAAVSGVHGSFLKPSLEAMGITEDQWKKSKKIDDNISVNMGSIKNTWDKIPLSKEVDTMNIPISIDGYSNGVAVNVGNPHVVFFGKSIKDTDLESIGPKIENHELFPKKTNVEIVEVINSNLIEMRVWERGVGVTLACGSGACAAVYAAWKKGLIENNAEVKLERGSLHINTVSYTHLTLPTKA